VSVCNEADLCSKATHKHNGKRYWNSSNYKAAALNKRQLSKEYPYTTEAKQRGLTCDVNGNGKTTAKLSSCTSNGVTRTTTTAACPSNANKKTCNENAKDCNQTQLCSFAAHGVAQNRKWTSWSRHVTEAKRRGLTCGVTSPTTASNASSVKKKHCSQNAEVCNSTQLCRSATVISGGKKAWNKIYFIEHVTEAKRRGLTCGVGSTIKTTARRLTASTPNYRNRTAINYSFRNESVLRRKQIQYALKQLNYYTSSIDALYGPGTERAIIAYAKSKGQVQTLL
jgi:hypothetical protein